MNGSNYVGESSYKGRIIYTKICPQLDWSYWVGADRQWALRPLAARGFKDAFAARCAAERAIDTQRSRSSFTESRLLALKEERDRRSKKRMQAAVQHLHKKAMS